MKLLASRITKIRSIRLPDFSHLHRGSLIAAGVAVFSAILFIIIPDTQTAAHGLRSEREAERLERAIQALHDKDSSFSDVSNADLLKIDPDIVAAEGTTGASAILQDGWLTRLSVKPTTVAHPADAFVLSFVDADAYACPRVVNAMAGEAVRISVAGSEVIGTAASNPDAAQLQTLCSGPDAVIELTFSRAGR